MRTPKLIMASVAAVLAAAAAPAAKAGSTFYFNANQSYLSASDSPFSGGNIKLENFEDGLLDVGGVSVNRGSVKGPGSKTDSVDDDHGPIDGKGNSGRSFSSGSHKSVTFKFTEGSQGLPTMAGIVWTDGKHNSTITFKAWDDDGNLIGKIKKTLGDLVKTGTTGEDRFFGLTSDNGISKIQISSNYANFELDHLTFSYGLSVVPVPPAVALGLAGLAGLGLWQGRMMRRRDQIS